MPIRIKSPDDLEAMRKAGRAAWRVLRRAVDNCRAGITTRELDASIEADIRAADAEPVLMGIELEGGRRFPANSVITLNEEAAHAPPGDRVVRDGDLVTIDLALRLNGWCADVATPVVVGEGSPSAHRLAGAARKCLDRALASLAPGQRWSRVARAMAEAAAEAGTRLVDGLGGHGIGRDLHESPVAAIVPAAPGGTGPERAGPQDFILRPGMVLTIEPIVVLGEGAGPGPARPLVIGLEDGFTVAIRDRSWACHEERTVAVTRAGADVLTGP